MGERPYLILGAPLRFTQMAQEATRLYYLHEVEHKREQVERPEQAITEAVRLASAEPKLFFLKSTTALAKSRIGT